MATASRITVSTTAVRLDPGSADSIAGSRLVVKNTHATDAVNGQVEVPAGGQINVTTHWGSISLLFELRLLLLGLVSCGRSRHR
jgi:hypothetical protein